MFYRNTCTSRPFFISLFAGLAMFANAAHAANVFFAVANPAQHRLQLYAALNGVPVLWYAPTGVSAGTVAWPGTTCLSFGPTARDAKVFFQVIQAAKLTGAPYFFEVESTTCVISSFGVD